MLTRLKSLRKNAFKRSDNSHIRHLCGEAVKPFDSIPGPKSLPVIGTLWMYLPKFGRYKFDRIHWNGIYNFRKYGPLVCEEILPSVRVVWVFKPEDIETMYRCEGRYPQRRSHLAMEKYRADRPNIYSSGGLLPTNGPEWNRLRKLFQRDLSKISNVRSYMAPSDVVIKKFLHHCEQTPVADLLPSLSRLFLELTGLVVFDESLNSFAESEFQSDSRSSKLIDAASTINELVLKTDNGPQLWKYFNTPTYRKYCRAHSYLEKIASEFIDKKMRTVKTIHEASSLLELYLSNEELDKKDIFGMMVDMLLAGMDTMAYSSSFAFYHIARNPDKQEILFQEVRRLVPKINAPLTTEVLNECGYTKAVMKEVFRLNPVSIGTGRILAEDAVLSGYQVPAGTITVTQNQVTCRLAEYFPDPNSFIPERWLRESDGHKIHPYLVLPFGHGPRTCIARRLAEQNLQLLIINAVRNYKLIWCGEELDCKSVQINKPDKAVLVKFEPRTM